MDERGAQVKAGNFSETSPILTDIAGVPHWQKANSGLIKMYLAEVLSKFPIVQHFFFGSVLRFTAKEAPAPPAQASDATARA